MTGRGPSIAVIVPNWNDSRYLTRCLASLLDQEVGPDEVIVVDDKSTDGSVALIRSLIAGHSNARLIENPVNLGVNGAINEGFRHSSSEYVVFVASNDFVLPGMFARAKACLARAPGVGLWSALAWIVDVEDRPLRLHPSPVVALQDTHIPAQRCIELAHRFGNWFTGTTLIYHREALRQAGLFDPVYMGMADLFTALIVASRHGVAYTPAPYAAIRKHPDSYLTRTLSDPAVLQDILTRIAAHGQRTAPELFTPTFVERTIRRFYSASVRTTGGATMGAIAERSRGWTARALRAADRLLPAGWRLARVVLAFLVLRPFDVASTVWNRGLGWSYIRLRTRWPG